jgi:ABC-type uncharacterized transport system substrate-binding protein
MLCVGAAIAVSLTIAPSLAQPSGPIPVVGWLFPRNPEDPPAQAFRQAMRKLGYVDGQNIHLEARWARGDTDRIPALVAEIMAHQPRVIVTNSEPAIRAVKDAAGPTPIVMAIVGDPVAAGFAASLARPGGNLTGFSNFGGGLVSKRLELLHEVVPNPGCTAVLRNPDDKALDPVYWREITEAAQRLGVALRPVLAPGARDLEAAFAEMAREGCQELVEMPNSALSAARTRIIDLAAKYRIAAIYDTREFVEVGGLMSYGPDLSDLYRRAADYVDKILKGAKPAELPVQQPDKFELVVNLKTAKALGVTIPPTILARADEVIE